MAQWLKDRKAESVGQGEHGRVPITPHEELQAAGFKVLLVNRRQLRGVGESREGIQPTASQASARAIVREAG